MSFFYQRIETEQEIKIIERPYALYLFLALGLLYLRIDYWLPMTGDLVASDWVGLSGIALIVLRMLVMAKVRKEIFSAMKNGQVSLSGSRFNPANPLVTTITKQLKPQAE